MLSSGGPTVPSFGRSYGLAEMTGEDSVIPYPSITVSPTAKKNSPTSVGRAAPPETKNFSRPPVLALTLVKTSLSATARLALSMIPAPPFISAR